MDLTLVSGNILALIISLEGGKMKTELPKEVGYQMRPLTRSDLQHSPEHGKVPMVK